MKLSDNPGKTYKSFESKEEQKAWNYLIRYYHSILDSDREISIRKVNKYQDILYNVTKLEGQKQYLIKIEYEDIKYMISGNYALSLEFAHFIGSKSIEIYKDLKLKELLNII